MTTTKTTVKENTNIQLKNTNYTNIAKHQMNLTNKVIFRPLYLL